MFCPQPGGHQGRVRRRREVIPQPDANRHQETVRPAVGPGRQRRMGNTDGADWVGSLPERLFGNVCFFRILS